MNDLSLQFIRDYGWPPAGKTIMHWFRLEGMFYTPGGRHKLTEYILRYDDSSKEIHIEGMFGAESEGKLFEGIVETEVEFLSLMKMLRIDGQIHGTNA